MEAEFIPWTTTMNAAQVRDHYASMIAVRRQPLRAQRELLDELNRVVETDFGGSVQRNFLTVMYSGRRPDHDESRAFEVHV